MTFLKSLWTDLVEKRLWPVAVVLLLALVAVPVALGGGDDGAPASTPLGATGATGSGGQVAQVALDPAVAVRRDRAGKVRDPFKQRAVAETGATAAGGATGAGGPSTEAPKESPPAGGGGGGKAPQGPSGPAGPKTPPETAPAPAPDPPDSYVVALRFGKAGAKRARRKVERLTPLPSPENPFFVYLGVLSDAKTAVFMLSSDVKATGDGACKPRKSSCETVELRRGDSELLEATADDGKVTRYRLDVVRITKELSPVPSRGVAASKAVKKPKSSTKASSDDGLRSDRYKYDDATGLLRRVKRAPGLGAHLPTMSEGPRATLRGAAAPEGPAALPRFLPGS